MLIMSSKLQEYVFEEEDWVIAQTKKIWKYIQMIMTLSYSCIYMSIKKGIP